MLAKLRILHFNLENKNREILAALQYKLLYNISPSEKWGKKIQAAAYNGARKVNINLRSFEGEDMLYTILPRTGRGKEGQLHPSFHSSAYGPVMKCHQQCT